MTNVCITIDSCLPLPTPPIKALSYIKQLLPIPYLRAVIWLLPFIPVTIQHSLVNQDLEH